MRKLHRNEKNQTPGMLYEVNSMINRAIRLSKEKDATTEAAIRARIDAQMLVLAAVTIPVMKVLQHTETKAPLPETLPQ